MQIGADSPNTILSAITIILTLDLLNPKSTGFDKASRTILCQVSCHCYQAFSFYRSC